MDRWDAAKAIVTACADDILAFVKTRVGDLLMSLIHTCQFNDVNPFDYLTELRCHAADLPARPENWMPWNYRDGLRA